MYEFIHVSYLFVFSKFPANFVINTGCIMDIFLPSDTAISFNENPVQNTESIIVKCLGDLSFAWEVCD